MKRSLLVMLSTLLPHAQAASSADPKAVVTPDEIRLLADRAERELRDNILPFWGRHAADRERGGFHGGISNDLQVDRKAIRSAIITARALWTYSAAARLYPGAGYEEMARWSYDDLLARFLDREHGGLFWTATAEGRPLDTRKEIYGQVFGIYGLAEYHRATGSREALEHAIAIYRLIEQHARDPVHGGYFEAFAADWRRHGPEVPSVLGTVGTKSQNTHLHVMEAYTNLLRVWPDPALRETQRELVRLMLGRILDPQTHRLRLFFDDDWTPRSDRVSYGHDIEAAWLLVEAAEVLGDADLLAQSREAAVAIAAATLTDGVDKDGGVFAEGGAEGPDNRVKDWWPQAEAVVGFLNAWQISGDRRYFDAAATTWRFIEERLIDNEHGEWFAAIGPDGRVRPQPKVSPWKCPYHNGRACMELVTRLRSLLPEPGADADGAEGLTLNELEYLEMPGLNVMLAHDFYPESHQGGVGFIQNGLRVATNGDLRLEPAPGQWSPVPKVGPRVVDRETGEISVRMEYPDPEKDRKGFNPVEYPDLAFSYVVRVRPEGRSFRIVVDLEQPLPEAWIGRVGFNLELFPGFLFGKTFAAGDTTGVFPRQPNGPGRLGTDGTLELEPLAAGPRLAVAPESEEQRLLIENLGAGDLQLLDGRAQHTNGWFVVRSLVPKGAGACAIDWRVSPHAIPGWKSRPVVQVSQVGYHPRQHKMAVIELDPRDDARFPVRVERIHPDGGREVVLEEKAAEWGRFLRYHYLRLDFTRVAAPGMYVVAYGNERSEPFKIGADVYARHVWQPTLEYFLPVQMCHMRVNDRYRAWHGCCHLWDARMAPVDHNHFDGYHQGASTLCRFQPGEPVPGLDRGGWHDAGDYDLRVESQSETIRGLALAWEEFQPAHDNTTIDQEARLVEIHRPDGKPDILQQIEHGALSITGGYRALGRLYRGIIEPTLRDYVLLGDPLNHEAPRWVFTEDNPRRELLVAAGLAAASRALRGFNDPLAAECLEIALELWRSARDTVPPARVGAAVELLLATEDRAFADFLTAHRDDICNSIAWTGWLVARVLPQVSDQAFNGAVLEAVKRQREEIERTERRNPYGVAYEPNIWGAGWGIQRFGKEQYFLHKAFPEIFPARMMLHALDFVLGCHPGSNPASFVSGVGARSLLVAYGVNRADWSHIPGGSASGTALIRPDYPELLEWPYLWQQTEYVVGGGTTDYLFLVLAADRVLNDRPPAGG